MALAVVVVGLLHATLPGDFRVSPGLRYAYMAILLAFLVVLTIGDPGRIDRDRPWLRVTTILMTGLITTSTALATN